MEKMINLEELNRKLKVIEENMVTKNELNFALETIMVFSNEDTIRQIKQSDDDILSGRTKKINFVDEI